MSKPFETLMKALGAAVILVPLPVLTGLHAKVTSHDDFFSPWVAMQFNSALGTTLLGAALLALSFRKWNLARVLIVLPLLLAVTTLLEYVSGRSLGIDELFFHAVSAVVRGYPGRMSPNNTISLITLGSAIALLSRERISGSRYSFGAILASIPLAIGIATTYGFLRGSFASPNLGSFAHTSFPSAIVFTLGAGGLLARCLRGLLLARNENFRIIPTLTTLVLLLGFISLWQFQLEREAIYQRRLISNEAERIKVDLSFALKQTSQAMQRFATRVEYLGSKDRNYLKLDSQSYLEQLTMLKRIGLTDVNYKVVWSYPEDIQAQVHGFDESQIDRRFAAIELARLNKRPSLSGSIELKSGGWGFLLPVPLFRKDRFEGIVYGTVLAEKLFDGRVKPEDFQLNIFEGERVLYRSENRGHPVREFVNETDFTWGLSHWRFEITPTASFIASVQSPLPYIFLLVGGLVSLLIGAFLSSVFRASQEAVLSSEMSKVLNLRLRVALNASLMAAWSVDLKTREMWRSEDHDLIFGYAERQDHWNSDKGLAHVIPEDRERVERLANGAVNSAAPSRIEFRIRRADNQEIRWVTVITQIENDSNGEPKQMIGIVRDITVEKHEALDRELTHERLERVIGATGEGIWERVYAPGNDHVRFIDEQCKAHFGYGPDEKPTVAEITARLYDEEKPGIAAMVENHVSQNTPRFNIEYRLKDRHHPETFKWLRSRGRVIHTPGEPSLLLATVSDITREVENRERLKEATRAAEAATRAKADFLANMSHEIRTPLNGVIGMADLLMESELDGDQRTYAGIIQQSGASLLTLINDILDFSKIEAGKFEFEKIEFALPQAVEGPADVLVAKAREKGLSLMTYISNDLPRKVLGDPSRIGQILLNLAGNAIKFTTAGGVAIRVKPCAAPGADDKIVRVRFEIEDTGIGLSADDQAKLFRPFVQADQSTARKYGGTGLGLSICKSLVENMHGTIGVESGEGRGSRFWFEIPFEVAVGSEAVPIARRVSQSPERVRVLIVDEDSVATEILQLYMTSWGIRNESLSRFADTPAVLRRARDDGDPFTLAIIGYGMTADPGLRLGAEIRRELGPAAPRLILMTEFEKSVKIAAARSAGFSQVVAKPVKQSGLFDALAKALQSELYDLAEKVVPIKAEAAAVSSARILLADDVIANQILTLKLLQNLGYRAQAVNNGLEVLEALKIGQYDLILMDCQMPELDGYEATKRIRLLADATTRQIPIIALTANAVSGDEQKCLAAGMDDYLSKPIKKDRLHAKIEKCLAEKQRRKTAA